MTDGHKNKRHNRDLTFDMRERGNARKACECVCVCVRERGVCVSLWISNNEAGDLSSPIHQSSRTRGI
jgi:hypothetical protein